MKTSPTHQGAGPGWAVPEPFSPSYILRLNQIYRRLLLPFALLALIGVYGNRDTHSLSPAGMVAPTMLIVAVWLALLRFPRHTLLILRFSLYGTFLAFLTELVGCYVLPPTSSQSDVAGIGLAISLFGLSLLIVAAHTLHAPALARLTSLSMWLISSLAACGGLVFAWSQGLFTPALAQQTLRFLVGGSVAFGMATILSELYGLQVHLEAQKSLLRHYALTDSLTGLPNRRAFESSLGSEYSRAKRHEEPLSLVLLDIDSFKRINDARGHSAGDRVLEQVARLLSGVTRGSDQVARWGGEEFTLILPKTYLREALLLAERIRSEVASFDFGLGGITVSVGVALLEASDSPAALLQRADRALYRAKQRGRNRVELAEDQDGQVQDGDRQMSILDG